jgi:hypothetical protein
MARKKKIGECVYCGKTGYVTDEHTPPENLFPSSKPSDLIIVPCCKECNNKASDDDEYFRLVLSMRCDTSDHPEVLKNKTKLQRSLQKPEKKGFRASFVNSLAFVDLRTPAGIDCGKTLASRVDIKRVNDEIKRFTRGLFYKEKGRRLPDNYQVWACCINDIASEHPLFLGTFMMKDIINSTLQGKSITIGNDVFKYWYKFNIDDENISTWVLSFYGRVNFLALTIPNKITAQN